MWKDLDIFFRRFGVHDFLQIEFGNRELASGIKVRAGQRNAAPRQFTSDAHTVARILSYASGERQCFEQGLAPLHLMYAWRIHRAENGNRLAVHF